MSRKTKSTVTATGNVSFEAERLKPFSPLEQRRVGAMAILATSSLRPAKPYYCTAVFARGKHGGGSVMRLEWPGAHVALAIPVTIRYGAAEDGDTERPGVGEVAGKLREQLKVLGYERVEVECAEAVACA